MRKSNKKHYSNMTCAELTKYMAPINKYMSNLLRQIEKNKAKVRKAK